MRLAVLADIHGNVAALEAVLADLAALAPDAVVNLGDCLSGPLHAAATADRLMRLDWPTIRGNHDRQLVDRPPAAMGASDAHAHAELAPRHLDWLRGLPPSRVVAEAFCCHAVPDDDLAYGTESIAGPTVRLASAAELEARYGAVVAPVILCGHTHVPRLLRLASGTLVVNPGSVGLQAFTDDVPHVCAVEVGSPHVRYAILERRAGVWSVSFRTVAYDWTAAAATAADRGRADWAHALATGRVGP